MTHSFYHNPDTNVIEGITIQTNGHGTYYFSITDPTCTYAHGPDICQYALNALHNEVDVSEQLLILFYKEIIHESLYQHVKHAVNQVVHEISSLAQFHNHMEPTYKRDNKEISNFADQVLWDQEIWMRAIRRSSDVIATFAVTQTDITEEV